MPKRLRLLIMEADKATIDHQRAHDGIRPGTQTRLHSGKNREDVRWTSIELDPRRITILELLRLFWREARHRNV